MWQNDHERATRASRRSPRRQGLFRIYTAVAVVTGSLGFLRAAHSSTLTWDASGANPTDPADGTGTWDTSPDADWSDGSTDFVWNADTTGSTDTAVFGNNNGAAGTVTLSAPLSTGSISFLSPGTGSISSVIPPANSPFPPATFLSPPTFRQRLLRRSPDQTA